MNTNFHDELLIPLLRRMLNLKKLDLSVIVYGKKTFIDGNSLKENIINYMPRLNKFTLNIRSHIRRVNQTNLPSNEDIQHTFKDLTDNQIISNSDYFEKRSHSHCHVYSYPYSMKYYDNITNNIPGGLFKYVLQVSLYSERPFEREFFLQIQKSFPFMKELTVKNKKLQKNKFDRKSKNNNQDLSMIKYPHLTKLILEDIHDNYIAQFLVDTEMCLPNNVTLLDDFQALKRVTENFTRDTTRINCAKLSHLCVAGGCKKNKHVKDYFPHADIDY